MTARRLAGRCAEVVRGMAAMRSASVSRLRRAARAAIVARQSERARERRRLRLSLLQHRAAIVASLRAPAARPAARADAVQELPLQRACAGVWELCTEPAEPPRPARPPLTEQVVRAIARHPDGMIARDLGNELGVDWRRVVGVTAELVDAGVIERIGSRFYPAAGKASGQ